MYFSDPVGEQRTEKTPLLSFSVLAMAVATLLFGLFSGRVLDLAQNWIEAFRVVA